MKIYTYTLRPMHIYMERVFIITKGNSVKSITCHLERNVYNMA